MTGDYKDYKQMALTALAVGTEDEAGPCLAEEDLALLLDGRLAEPERSRLLEHLNACPSCYRLWIDSWISIEKVRQLNARTPGRVVALLGTRLNPEELTKMDPSERGVLLTGTPEFAQVVGQAEEWRHLQCPWCGRIGMAEIGNHHWFLCGACGRPFKP